MHECTCSNRVVENYQKRISGPLMDRIDIHVEVPHVEYEKLASNALAEPSSAVRAQVEVARERQLDRFKDTSLHANADMGPAEVRKFCQLDGAGKSLMKAAVTQMDLSARAYHRVLKLARFPRERKCIQKRPSSSIGMLSNDSSSRISPASSQKVVHLGRKQMAP